MKLYVINEKLLGLLIKAIAKAEDEKAFAGCVVPKIGEKLLERLGNLEEIKYK